MDNNWWLVLNCYFLMQFKEKYTVKLFIMINTLVQYKYIQNNARVYVLIKETNNKVPFVNKPFQTTPFLHKQDNRNVLSSYKHKHMASYYMHNNNDKCYIETVVLDDMIYVAYLMKMPLVVVDNEYCDVATKQHVVEMYYTYPLGYDFQF
jgi:hypothetical protein